MEKIGKVSLNCDFYSGTDMYSDGDVEDLLLSIVRSTPENKFNEVIAQYKSWPILYHLSCIRENILNWFPFRAGDRILEVGAGCGAVTGALTAHGCEVTAVDLSKKRSLINAYRHQQCDHLEIMVGNLNDIAENLHTEYDYITLIGVFEYAETYIPGEHSADELLKKLKTLLAPGGKIIIAIENQLGLKYFAGCKEDHVGLFFEGIENYTTTHGVRTYSKKKISDILRDNGFYNLAFYYPYPDYKLPSRIYSDSMLPQASELIDNARNFDASRMVLFDESKAWTTIIEAGLFPEFSNSFLIVAN